MQQETEAESDTTTPIESFTAVDTMAGDTAVPGDAGDKMWYEVTAAPSDTAVPGDVSHNIPRP